MPHPRGAMLVLWSGLGEVQNGVHDGSVLDEKFPHIPRPSTAGLLTSEENDRPAGPKIFWLLIVLTRGWSRELCEMVAVSIAIGVHRIHFKERRTTAVLGIPRKN